jgi:hypothetical protein
MARKLLAVAGRLHSGRGTRLASVVRAASWCYQENGTATLSLPLSARAGTLLAEYDSLAGRAGPVIASRGICVTTSPASSYIVTC